MPNAIEARKSMNTPMLYLEELQSGILCVKEGSHSDHVNVFLIKGGFIL